MFFKPTLPVAPSGKCSTWISRIPVWAFIIIIIANVVRSLLKKVSTCTCRMIRPVTARLTPTCRHNVLAVSILTVARTVFRERCSRWGIEDRVRYIIWSQDTPTTPC